MRKIISILAFALCFSVAVAQTNGSKPLDLSMLLLTLQSYQPTNALGKTNGYAPLNSNAVVPPEFLFPSFTNSANGAFWVKSGAVMAPVSGLSISSNLLSVSKVGVGQISTSPALYGVKIDNANDPLVLKGGNQNKVYVANQNWFGAADGSYSNYVWSVNPAGSFTFVTGTVQSNLSMNSSSITNVLQVMRQNGMLINFSNRTISGYGNAISVAENLVVPNISKANLQTNVSASTYALNANSADLIFTRSDKTNPWTVAQTFPSIALSNALPVTSGGTGVTDKTNFRISFGLVIGTNVQAQSAILQAIANTSATNNSMLVWNGSIWTNRPPATVRSNLGLVVGTDVQAFSPYLQYIATATNQATNNILMWGGTNWSTKTPEQARAGLGVAIGTNVQAYSATLSAIANTSNLAGTNYFMVGNGSGWVASPPSTARSSIGLGWAPLTNTSSSSFASAASLVLTNGNGGGITNLQASNIVGVLPITNGGTGASNAPTARTNLGIGGGLDGIKTNIMGGVTNVIYFNSGVITNWTTNGVSL